MAIAPATNVRRSVLIFDMLFPLSFRVGNQTHDRFCDAPDAKAGIFWAVLRARVGFGQTKMKGDLEAIGDNVEKGQPRIPI